METKRRIFILSFLFLSYSFSCLGQNTIGTQSQGVDMNVRPFGVVESFDNREIKLLGTPYLYEAFKSAEVFTTFSDTITFKRARFNLMSNNIEFEEDEFNKFLASKYIKSINFYSAMEDCLCDEYKVIDSNDTKFDNKLAKEIPLKDNLFLIKLQYAVIDKGNYNKVLDVGEPDDEIKIREHLYLSDGTNYYDLQVNKKSFSKYFNNTKQLRKDLNKYNYSYTEADGLLKILDKFDLRSN